jgi:hypothetical protein
MAKTSVDQMAGGGTVVAHEHPQDAMSRPHAAIKESTDVPSFQEAFEQAKREHSAPAEEAAGDEASTDDGDEDEAPARLAAPEPAAHSDKVETSELLTDAEYEALETKHADDPKALRRALEGAYTKKTQARAAERRSYERLQPYADLVDALEDDDEAPAAIARLAEQRGFKLVRPGEPTDEGEAEGEEAPAALGTTAEQLAEELRGELGEEYDYLVDPLSRALSKVADKLVTQRVDAQTKPIKAQQEVIINRAATEETKAVMAGFDAKHPDWKEHEDAMFEIAQTLSPKGLTEIEYLERCYQLATRDAWEKNRDANVANEVKKAVAKIQKGAASTETQTRSTPESQVRIGPPAGRVPDFQDAYEAAKRGERWE